MASSSSSPSAPALSSQSWSYDVFLSFRGEDTRKTFVDHLYAALDQQGIYAYKDDVRLPRGESINPALLKAIEESQIAVIIFSENYANSTWCLDELTHIMKSRDQRKQIVMPIFYDVEPSEVRKQKRTYKEAFEKHEPENKANVESWRKVLVKASNISGWEIKQIANGHEAQGIKQIVDEISWSLKLVTSGAEENLIGIKTRVKALKSELQIESGGVRMIGIWGLGGGGKTTLASAIYDAISREYDGCCFVNNIREESSKNGLEKLQEKLLSGILKQKHVHEVSRVEDGKRMLRARLHHKKVLIVLDDVDQLDQLKALVGSHDWVGEGSRIIITTRDAHLLNAHKVDGMHHISLLNRDEAVKLFRKHANRDNRSMEDFKQLSKEVVSYAGGLPLALTVLGSFLCDKNSSQWRSALARLKKIPDEDILGKLKISFDGLKAVEKELFLDIACFFRRRFYTDRLMNLFDACGFDPIIGVEVLRQKALIIITKEGTFDMHDLVQEMGHYIVREKHPYNPEKHSRVWKREDVLRILAMDATIKLDNIEAIDLYDVSYEESQRFPQVAANMNKLRWIDLRVNQWTKEQRDEIIFPLPENFPPGEIRYLETRNGISQKQLWEGYKYLPNLARMVLGDLCNLIKIPDFSGLSNLETFKLWKCTCLEEIHPSIGHLERLVYISIEECPRLRMFPSITRIKKLETLVFGSCKKLAIISDMDNLPHLHLGDSGKEVASCEEPHYKLNHRRRLWFLHSTLKKLELSWCCLGDEEISSAFMELPNLEALNLSGNPFSRLDFSILRLPRLKWLKVSHCRGLAELSELPSSIAVVIADECCSLESFGDISNCKWLWKVSIWGKHKLDQLCGDTLIDYMLQGNASEDHFISVALRHHFPNRFVGRLFWGNTFRLHLPDDWYKDFCGFLICVVTDSIDPIINIFIKKEDPPFDLSQESDEVHDGKLTCIGYVSFSSLRHTTPFTSSYNTISLDTDIRDFDCAIELLPRKSKSDEVQTTDYSEFWDDNFEDEKLNPFTIQQSDSDSSVRILWKPYNFLLP